jgi:acyl-CoA synthetase (AMP-forming)/AMP-acid ligase II
MKVVDAEKAVRNADVACFATGDLGWVDPATGVLHVTGRADQQLKIGGALFMPRVP